MKSMREELDQALRTWEGLKEARGDETKLRAVYGKHQISFFAEVGPQGQRQLAAKCTRKGEQKKKIYIYIYISKKGQMKEGDK